MPRQKMVIPAPTCYCRPSDFHYIKAVSYLTRQERIVLCIVVGLLMTGWLVKWYRTAHPAAAVAQQPMP